MDNYTKSNRSNKIKSEPEYWKTMQKIGKDVVICLSIPVSNNED